MHRVIEYILFRAVLHHAAEIHYADLVGNMFYDGKIVRNEYIGKIVVYLQKGIYDLTNDEEYLIKDSLYSLVDKSMNVKIQYTNRFIQSSSKFKPVIRIFD